MPGPTALVDLTTAREYLNQSNATNDAEIMRFINRLTPIIEDIGGPVIQRTVSDEQHTSVRGNKIPLVWRPVVSISNCVEYLGRVGYTVTLADTPDLTGTYGATLDKDKGVLTRWTTGVPRDWASPVYVTYIAGRTSVPANIEGAALELLRHMWETQRGRSAGRPMPGYDDEPMIRTPSGYLVPNRVMEAFGSAQRMDGFA